MSAVPPGAASTGGGSSAYPPPALPATFALEVFTLPRARLHRVYWDGQDPLAPARKATNRYDCPASIPETNRYGVLYLGYEFETCWLEAVVRDSVVRPAGNPITVPRTQMQPRWACEVHVASQLTLAKFADESLLDLGDSASNIMGDRYLRTHAWSRLLHAHSNPAVDGVHYRSRFKSNEFCIALFDRGISKGNLSVSNNRSIDPETSSEMQSLCRRFNVLPL